MDKRKLSAMPRVEATPEMVEMADRMPGIKHMVTAELVDDNKILLLNFFEVSKLKKGKQKQHSGHSCRVMIISPRTSRCQRLSGSRQHSTICRTSTYGIMNGMETNICTSHSCSSGPQMTRRSWKSSSAVTAENRMKACGMPLEGSRMKSEMHD